MARRGLARRRLDLAAEAQVTIVGRPLMRFEVPASRQIPRSAA
jgi:hypothetical protein